MYATHVSDCPASTPDSADDWSHTCTYDYTSETYTTVAFSLRGNLLRWFRDQWAQARWRPARSGEDAYELLFAPVGRPTISWYCPTLPVGTPYFDARLPALCWPRPRPRAAIPGGLWKECHGMRLNVEILEASPAIAEFRAIGGARSTVSTSSRPRF